MSQFADPDTGPQILLSMFRYDNVITSVALLYKHVMQAKHIEKEPKVKPEMLYHGYTFGLPQGHARGTSDGPNMRFGRLSTWMDNGLFSMTKASLQHCRC